jgi:hypothetical protein
MAMRTRVDNKINLCEGGEELARRGVYDSALRNFKEVYSQDVRYARAVFGMAEFFTKKLELSVGSLDSVSGLKKSPNPLISRMLRQMRSTLLNRAAGYV